MAEESEYEMGLAAHRTGRLELAEGYYQDILSRQPSHAGAQHHLGLIQHQRGDHALAESMIRRALALAPEDWDAWGNLSAVLRALGRRGEAIEILRTVRKACPAHAPTVQNLGVLLSETGSSAEALPFLQEAERMDPGKASVHKHLGLSLLRLDRAREALPYLKSAHGQRPQEIELQNDYALALNRCRAFREAIPIFRRCLAAAPENVPTLINLGDALNECGESAEAETLLRRAIQLAPSVPEAHNNLGVALGRLGRHTEAVSALRRALELKPDYVPAHHNLANELLSDGQVAAGLESLQNALKLNGGCIPAWYALATTGKHQFSPEEFADLEALFADPIRSDSERTLLHFALAHALEKREPAAAFKHAVEANRLRKEDLRKQGVAYEPVAHTAAVDAIIAAFTPELFAQRADLGSPSTLPIFIVGMPRSGTTLAEQVLASHPEVFAAGELEEIALLARAIPGFPESLATLSGEIIRELSGKHLDRLRQMGGTASRVVDKMTLNFLRVGLLALLFPRAKVIHTRRDPRDIALSCFFHNFSAPGLAFTFDLQDLAHYYREYERLMAHWRSVLPVPMHEITYETFVSDPEAHTRALLEFCELPWDDQCLLPHRAKRRVKTASVLQVREPIYTRSVARWRPFENHLSSFPNLPLPPPNMAEILRQARARNWPEALAAADRLLRLYPDHAPTLNNRGVILSEMGQWEDAVAAQKAAIESLPAFTKAHHDLGLLYYRKGLRPEAHAAFQAALDLDPNFPDALHNQGHLLVEEGSIEAGIAALARASEVNPRNADTWCTLGAALQVLGRTDEALACYEKAIQLAPDHTLAHFNRAFSWLLRGDFDRGWKEHEWRLRRTDLRGVASLHPRWNGQPVNRLLIVTEQGLGDAIQFIRYVHQARALAKQVLVAAPAHLIPLLRSISGVDVWIPKEGVLPEFDAAVPLLSLPHVLPPGDIPAKSPYLSVPAERISHWRARFAGNEPLQVGINWQGNPKFSRDDLRSIPLKAFAPLAAVADLHSLHLGSGLPQLAGCGFQVSHLSAEFDESLGTFVDTGAAMSALDLVITSDTSLAHLAGALGVPVWLLLSANPDWRWREHGETSAWYPSMRIFRQRKLRKWDDLLAEVASALAGYRKAPPPK